MKPEIVAGIVSASVSVLTFFILYQSRVTSSERRLTILEEENRQQAKTLEECKRRLDNHDVQNQALIRLTVQMDELTKKIDSLDERIKNQ
ncbi:hypothetical protein AALH12_07570 [Streptococcus ferus]|uniref:DUF7365 family protein n=1 Tax=Streptococcus ferus TaxID=1345 RepID=UPI00351223DE